MSTRSRLLLELPRILRFGAVGLLNTALGYAVILGALQFGYGDVVSNATGFAAGLVLSFVLNRNWTFNRATGYRSGTIQRYILTFVVAYSVNLAIVLAARAAGLIDNPFTHLAGIAAYSLTFYLGASRFVFVPSRRLTRVSAPSINMLATQCWPELLVLLGILVAYLLLNDIAVSHDVTWQMWIARQLLGGATLYRDILELNPPLWFWMALPVESMAQKFGIPSVQAMIAAVFLLATIALALLSALLAERTARERGLLLVAAFVATIIVPLPDFAQREHLALICALPYVALIARRADSLPTNWKIAAAAALIAGAGLALKHYFVLVPMVLEIWLLLKQRRNWTPLRAELIVLSSIGALYAVAVVVFAPDFLGTMVPMVNLAYAGYETTFVDQFARPYLALWALCAFALWKQRSEATSLTVAAALAALAFSLAYFAQQKGWRYHSIPATSLALFATATLWHRLRWKSTTLPAGVAMAAAVFVPIYASLVHGPHQNLVEKEVNDLLSDSKPGKTVVMLTANPSSIWPMVEDAGLKWPSRHFTFWMVHTIFAYQNEHGQLSSELERLAQDVRQQTVEDFTCNPPEMILVDDFRYSRSPGFDIVDFFSENAEFRQLFAHYDLVRQVDAYASYKKSDAWVPTASSHCRTIH